MAALLNPLLRFLGIRKRIGREAKALRRCGDEARDRRRWREAAEAYRAYLADAPHDFGIWIQLGHSYKEAGANDLAEEAYAAALRLRPRDADLHLQLGHFYKLIGKMPVAAAHYARSLTIDRNHHAWRELSAPAFVPYVASPEEQLLRQIEQDTLNRLRSYADGLHLISSSGVMISPAGHIELASDNPWLMFGIDDIAVPPIAGLLEIGIERTDSEGDASSEAPMGWLDIDYGGGFGEGRSLAFRRDGNTERSIILVGVDAHTRIRWSLGSRHGRYRTLRASYRSVTDSAALRAIVEKAAGDDPALRAIALESLDRLLAGGVKAFDGRLSATRLLMPGIFDPHFNYPLWLRRYYTLTGADYEQIDALSQALVRRPSFSFVMPVYNSPAHLLAKCIESLLAQTYPDFEICIADDHSTDEKTREILELYAAKDARIKLCWRTTNGHISAASNSALEMATGEFVVLIDHDDLVPDFALFVVAYYLNRYPDAKILFSDEDKIDGEGDRFEPYFKGMFNKYLMYGHNMVSHLGVYDRALVKAIGGFRLGLEGSQDYDLFLRAYERIREDQVIHIPHILYHWRAIAGSTAVSADQKGYAVAAARDAINGHFERTGMPIRSTFGFAPGVTALIPDRTYHTAVSIIIPTHDGLHLLRPCVESIYATNPADFELLIVDNRSSDPATLEYLDVLAQRPEVRILSDPRPFNFSEINNAAAVAARGEILCFLNNDTEVLDARWLDRARGWLAIDEIGMVGARLLYEDNTLQHFGIGLGMAEHKVAAMPHADLPAEAPGYFGKARLMAEHSAVTAACMFIRTRDFRELGGFAPELAVAFNDVDLSIRVRQRGRRILCDPDILLIHKESRTRGRDREDEQRGRRLDLEARWMRERWAQVLDDDPYLSPNQMLDHGEFVLAYPPRVPLPWRAADA